MQKASRATFFLLLTTAIWGTTFPLIKNAVAHIDPLLFVGIRFSLAGLLLLPFVWFALQHSNKRLLMHGLLLGIINSIAYTSQTIGLQTISSARTAFITGFSVVIVPLLTPLFRLGNPKPLDIVCSFICLIGLFILTGANLSQLSSGDYWTFLGAILFALTIVYLQFISLQIDNSKALTFYQILLTAPLPLILSWHNDYQVLFNKQVLIGIIFCALIATSLAIYLQTQYQRYISAARAAIIYSLEPVFASLFGYWINNEVITLHTVMGGLLILLSLMIPGIIGLARKS